MKKNYIKIYEDAYQEAETLREEELRIKVLEFKSKKKKYLFGANSIVNAYKKEKLGFIILQKPFINLKYLFDRRAEEFEDDLLLDVIPYNLLTEYDNNENLYGKYSFETLIIELAKFKAISNTHRIFGLNYDCYKLMHKLNDFSQFKIKGLTCRNSQGLHEELRLRYYEPQKINIEDKEQFENLLPLKDKKNEKFNFNNFERNIILKKEFYNDLTLSYIDETDLKYEDFVNILTKNFRETKSIIRFSCDDTTACYLLDELRLRIKKSSNFNQTSISESQKFKFSDLKNIEQTKISKKRKMVDKNEAEDVLFFLKKYF